MKQIFESQEVFTAYAMVDYYNMLLANQVQKFGNLVSPIERMIDEATGYSDSQAKEIIETLEKIIENKKIIEADYSNQVKMIEKINEYLTMKPT